MSERSKGLQFALATDEGGRRTRQVDGRLSRPSRGHREITWQPVACAIRQSTLDDGYGGVKGAWPCVSLRRSTAPLHRGACCHPQSLDLTADLTGEAQKCGPPDRSSPACRPTCSRARHASPSAGLRRCL